MNLTYDYTMFKETFESEFTWLNGFMRNVNRFGERDALYDPAGNRKWTYDKLNKDSNKLANKMKKDGVAKTTCSLCSSLTVPSFCSAISARKKSELSATPQTLTFLPAKLPKL